MSKRDNLLGRRFGRLIVIAPASAKSDADRNARWICQCDCGNQIITYAMHLKKAQVQSCGCLYEDRGDYTIRRSSLADAFRRRFG